MGIVEFFNFFWQLVSFPFIILQKCVLWYFGDGTPISLFTVLLTFAVIGMIINVFVHGANWSVHNK